MNDSSNLPEGSKAGSIPPILIYLVAIGALVVGIGFVCAKILVSMGMSAPQVRVPTLAAITPGEKVPAVPPNRIVLDALSIESSSEGITFISRGAPVMQFTPSPNGALQWVAAIRNPYAPLRIRDGSPFLSDAKQQLPISDNIGGLTGADGMFKQLTEKDFPRFPFFSSTPTTVGVVLGSAGGADPWRGVTLYLLDTVSDAVATVPIPDFAFPEWLRDRGNPPPYVLRREIALSYGGLSVPETVVASVQKYANNRYGDDNTVLGTMAADEFRRAFLTKEELAMLKSSEFSANSAAGGKLVPALQKMIRLMWYGKMLGKGESLNALLNQLHPSIGDAIRSSAALKPR